MSSEHIAPYESGADLYPTDLGLGWPIPSQFPYEKMPPLKGWTGKNGNVPSSTNILDWKMQYPHSNVLLRLGMHIIGIDVDDYGEKNGGTTFRETTLVHGKLKPTYKSTARGRGVSGIYFYKLGPGMDERKSKGDFGPGSDIEVIRFSHRYAVVHPSWHQGAGARYEWSHQGQPASPPRSSQLPQLPRSWWNHLTQTCECFEQQRQERRAQLTRYKNRPLSGQGAELAKMDFERGIKRLAAMPEGGRNNELSKLAGRTLLFDVMVNGVLTVDFVVDRLWIASETCGLDEEETKRTIESALEWAAQVTEEGE